MHNVVHTARFLKYVWPFYNIMHERVNAVFVFSRTSKLSDFMLIIKSFIQQIILDKGD